MNSGNFSIINIPTVIDPRGNLSFIQRGIIPFVPSNVEICPPVPRAGFLVSLAGDLSVDAPGCSFDLKDPQYGLLHVSAVNINSASADALWINLSETHLPRSYASINPPFEIQRVYYLTSLPEGAVRGGHSHFRQFVMISVLRGAFRLSLDDGFRLTHIFIDSSDAPVVVPPKVWRSMDSFSPGSILLILSSTPYDPSDYIYDYQLFKRLALRTVR